jgi:hypothetical protein
MITNENLSNLIKKLTEISSLAREYKLKDITLMKPLNRAKEKLHFFISKGEEIPPFGECAAIKIALCKMMKIQSYEENVILDVKEAFNPKYFEEEYGEEFSLKENVNKESVIAYINEKLGFQYDPTSLATILEKRKKMDAESPVLKKDENSTDFLEKKPKMSSTSISQLSSPLFFSNTGGASVIDKNSVLPFTIREPLQAALKELSKNPQYKDVAKDFFLTELSQNKQLVIG